VLAFVLLITAFVPFHTVLVQRMHLIVSVLIIAFVTAIVQILARKWTWLKKPVLSVVADIVLVSIMLYFSDGIQSPFYPLYYVTIIIVAIDFGMGGALVCAAVLAGLSLGIDIISPSRTFGEVLILHDVVRTVPYLFLIALITGALWNRMRVLDETASALRADRAASNREMEVASSIQRAQLPVETPTMQGVYIAAAYKPAREVGGDLYDFYPVKEDIVGVTIADVSGKGVPAALLVSASKYAIRANYSTDQGAMMSGINRHIIAVTTDEMFITMLHGTLTPHMREFKYVNAGHMPPIVVKGSTGEVLIHDHSDPPLGVSELCVYHEQRIPLEPGDTLVLYTDGVTDALSWLGDGTTAFKKFLAQVASKDINTWGDELINYIEAPHHLDDITMVAIRID